ncbi:MAG: hypothetical protein C4320_07255 [Armatimonadota bacterium]
MSKFEQHAGVHYLGGPSASRRPEGYLLPYGGTLQGVIWERTAGPLAPGSTSVLRVFRHRDFRLLFIGALFSFTGSWIQNVAQGYLVYELTGSKERLALISFMGMIPVTFLGPVGGGLVDSFDRRKLLAGAQVVLALGAGFLAVATFFHFVQYWMVLTVAVVSGTTGALETPARQAVVGVVVPPEDLSAALPMQAMPFNLARVVGPAIGGFLVAKYGAGSCYALNALSFSALIYAALAIHAELRPKERRGGSLWDIVLEGARYVFYESRLRRLFLYETSLSFFGLFYLSMLPAIAKDLLRVGPDGLGRCYTAAGLGAVAALFVNSWTSQHPVKGTLIKVALTLFTLALVGLSVASSAVPALIALGVLGFSAVVVFNTTNLLFQLIAPPAMRERFRCTNGRSRGSVRSGCISLARRRNGSGSRWPSRSERVC